MREEQNLATPCGLYCGSCRFYIGQRCAGCGSPDRERDAPSSIAAVVRSTFPSAQSVPTSRANSCVETSACILTGYLGKPGCRCREWRVVCESRAADLHLRERG